MIFIKIFNRKNNLRKKFHKLLIDKETLLCSYKLVTDIVYFTNLRIIYFDRKFLTRRLKRIIIPYRTIDTYTVVTGSFWHRKDHIYLLFGKNKFEIPVAEEINTREIDKLLGKYICQ
ncbi:MAG: PH domain-containing protein [Halanaerobiales bacterium]